MELRTLIYFVAVAEEGSVTAAAEVVHVTQPALSRQLRALQRELGIELFALTDRRLALSAAGREFLPVARNLVAEAGTAKQFAETLAAGSLNRLVIAAPTTTLSDVIAPFLASWGPTDPVATVREATSEQALDAVSRGTDLAILTHTPPRTFSQRLIAVLPLWAYVQPDHPWANRNEVQLEELADQVLILLTREFRPRQLVQEAFHTRGMSLPELIESSNAQVAQALAASGRGVAIVSDDSRFGLRPIRISTDTGLLTIDLYAAWAPAHHAAATLMSIADRLADFCAVRYGASETS
jgi:DNA-binding transcriptional LysR family regulator